MLLTPETKKQKPNQTNKKRVKDTYNSFSPKKLVSKQTKFSNRLIKADTGFTSIFHHSLEKIPVFTFLLVEENKA